MAQRPGMQWNGREFLKKINQQLEQEANRAGRDIVDMAKALVPVDTGYLRDNISWSYDKSERKLTIKSKAPYTLYKEFGTFCQRATPFLRPAINLYAPTGFYRGIGIAIRTQTYSPSHYTPRPFLPGIRRQIAATNFTHNMGPVRRSSLVATTVSRKTGKPTYVKNSRGKRKVQKASLSKLIWARKAWKTR